MANLYTLENGKILTDDSSIIISICSLVGFNLKLNVFIYTTLQFSFYIKVYIKLKKSIFDKI